MSKQAAVFDFFYMFCFVFVRFCNFTRYFEIMLTRFLFYFILYPLSILPLYLLYLLFVPIYLIMSYIVCYRRKVVDKNLSLSFPQWSKKK